MKITCRKEGNFSKSLYFVYSLKRKAEVKNSLLYIIGPTTSEDTVRLKPHTVKKGVNVCLHYIPKTQTKKKGFRVQDSIEYRILCGFSFLRGVDLNPG